MPILNKEVKNKFLEVAKEEFSGNGYRDTSMDSIAFMAGTSKMNIYRYFLDKNDLFEAVVDDVDDHTAFVLQAGRILSKYGFLNRYLMGLPDIELIRLMQDAHQQDGIAAAKEVF